MGVVRHEQALASERDHAGQLGRPALHGGERRLVARSVDGVQAPDAAHLRGGHGDRRQAEPVELGDDAPRQVVGVRRPDGVVDRAGDLHAEHGVVHRVVRAVPVALRLRQAGGDHPGVGQVVGVEGRPPGGVDHEVEQHHRPVLKLGGGGSHVGGDVVDERGQRRQRDGRPDLGGPELVVADGHARPVRARLEPRHRRPQAQLGSSCDGGVRQRLAELAEAAPRVEEGALRRVGGAEHLASDGNRRRRGDAAAGHLAGQLRPVDAPQLAGVRTVERSLDGRPQPGAHDLGVRVGSGAAQRRRDRVERHAGRQRARQRPHQVGGAQRERQEPTRHGDAAVARPDLEVPAEQATQLGEQGPVGARVQAVAAEVDPLARHLERAGQATHRRGPVEHDHLVAGARRVPGGQQARRACPDDGDHGVGSAGAGPAGAGSAGARSGEEPCGDGSPVAGRSVAPGAAPRGPEPTVPA